MSLVVISSDVVFDAPQISRPDAIPSVSIIEFDAPRCVLTYGVAPCTAAVGVTGSRKCFNTRATCQDIPNFDPDLVTFRFTKPSAQIHRDTGADVIPSVRIVRTTPQLLNPGRDMGQRESVTVTFEDHPHSDTGGFDPYVAERPYNPFAQGTFWGKFRARYPSLRGLPLRIYRGLLGQELSEMDVWHYSIETAALSGRSFTITAKDHLKFLDGERAQAPRVSLGSLLAAITELSGSLTLDPPGIGDADYPLSGRAAIGGKEIVDFTRAGDVVTLTARGVSNTEPAEHDAGDRFQIVLQFSAQPAEAIINTLLTDYTDIDPAWIPYSDWQTEVGAIVAQEYTAEIADPTDVRKLVNELIEQVGLIMWWDPQNLLVRLTALRPVLSTERVIDEETMEAGTFRAQEQPAKRISEVWTYFNLRNPLERLDDPANYQSVVVSIDPDADPEEPAAIHKVFSRWIGFGNRDAATRLNGLLLSRYSQPPRRFSYRLFRDSPMPTLGRGSQIEHPSIQDETGARLVRPVQVVSAEHDFDGTSFVVEEMIFAPNDELAAVRTIVIDTDAQNVNLRTVHDSFYDAPVGGENVLCVIASGVTIGSDDPTLPAFDIGDWPVGVNLEINNAGSIRGAGGRGGNGGTIFNFNGSPGDPGGVAIYTRYAVEIDNAPGLIAGGGGGGGGADNFVNYAGPGGGGGAGRIPGPGGGFFPPGSVGTETAGGAGAADSARTAGNGGAPGSPGDASLPDGGAGGAAGAAVDGDSFVTFIASGTILGPQIN